MTVLSDKQIFERLGDTVIIEPFNPFNVNTSSYDVTLGPWYFRERRTDRPLYNIWDYDDVRRIWGNPIKAEGSFIGVKGISPDDLVIPLPPRANILAHTIEFIGGRRNVTTFMQARSSYGRNFIEVCKCAGYGDVGYTNRWTMEITNNSEHYTIPLVVGRRIAQIVFVETGELIGDEYPTTGKYQSTDNLPWFPEMMLPRLDLDRDMPNAR